MSRGQRITDRLPRKVSGCDLLLLGASWLLLADAAAARELRGRLVAVDEAGERRAVAGAGVRSEPPLLATVSDDSGLFRLTIPDTYRPGTRLPLVVDKPGWVIRSPALGRVTVPPRVGAEVIDIELAAKGSQSLWTEDLLRQLVIDAALASVQSRPASAERRELDFRRVLSDWAEANGFRLVDAVREIERWSRASEDIQDAHTRGLARIVQRRFAAAMADFELATATRHGEIAALRPRHARRQQTNMAVLERRLAESLRLAALSAYLAEDFAGAARRLREVLARSPQHLAPSDWSRVQNGLGSALSEQALRTEGDSAARSLAEAASAFRVALDNLDRDRAPRLWAAIQNNLGLVLREQAVRASGEAFARLSDEAESTFRLALEVRAGGELSVDRALTQYDIGSLLQLQAARLGGEAGLRRLAQAIAAFRDACGALPGDDLPRLWAAAQTQLGGALASLAAQGGGEMSSELLAEATEAFRAALGIFTTFHLARDWAATQTHLGNVLQEQGYRAEGETSRQLYAQAITAYRAALEVFTREQYPALWAATANNLGTALEALGRRTDGEAGDKLLRAAAAGHRSVLAVFTRDAHPRDWATTQNHLGNALHGQALRAAPETAARHFLEALAAHGAALEVLTRDAAPELWRLVRADEARALEDSGQAAAAAEALREILVATPGEREIMLRLVALYHEVLHDSAAAVGVVSDWLQRFPDDTLAAVRSVELLFATGRHRETAFLARHLATGRAAAAPELQIVLRAYEVASWLTAQNLDEAAAALRELHRLVTTRFDDWQPQWRYAGTRHYLAGAADLHNRDAVDRLFGALEGPDREAVLSGLERIENGVERGLARLESAGDR